MAIQELTLDPNAAGAEDQSLEVRNSSGGDFSEGDLVYVDGWDEANLAWSIALAEASALAPRMAQWVLRGALADATNGTAFKSHRLTGEDTSGQVVGDPVYLSDSTPGDAVFTAPNFDRQVVGRVAVVNVAGEIEFFVQSDTDSGFVRGTDPSSGNHPVRAVNRLADGTVSVSFDDVAAP